MASLAVLEIFRQKTAPAFEVALRSPGLELLGGYEAHDPDDFAEAALLLAVADPALRTGTSVFHHDLLDETQPARGWHGSAP